MVLQVSFRNRILSESDFIPAQAEKGRSRSTWRANPPHRKPKTCSLPGAVEAGVTSNSVIFVKDGCSVAIGTGEQDRVGCVELTIGKAYVKYADRLAFEQFGISLYELQAKAEATPDAEAEGTTYAGGLEAINARTKEAKRRHSRFRARIRWILSVSRRRGPGRKTGAWPPLRQPGGSIRGL